ncbi:MAG: C_GCAxxG_C_C family protein [Chloroflexi bacterium]|nr:C_GCAxxG_C_C family protein [Chloroflexota bacterium]
MKKTNGEPTRRAELRERIEAYLDEGRQCSQCLLLALEDVLGLRAELLSGAARTLGRGMGGSGAVCGTLTAGMLALGLAYPSGDPEATPGSLARGGPAPAPHNEFLDAYIPSEPPVFARCRELVAWFGAEVMARAGSINCQDISGVHWDRPTGEELSRYFAPAGGLSHCVDLMSRTAERVAELVLREGRRPDYRLS